MLSGRRVAWVWYPVFVLILGLALALRLEGIFDRAGTHYVDEHIHVHSAMRLLLGRQVTILAWPDLLGIWASQAALAVHGIILKVQGTISTPHDLFARFLVTPDPFWVTARVPSLLVGLAVVVMSALVARRLFGVATGLVCAALVAASPLLSRMSTWALGDIWVALAFLVQFALLWRLLGRSTPMRLYVAWFALGVGCATKYNFALAVVPTLWVTFVAFRRSRRDENARVASKHLAAAALIFFLGLHAGNPYLLYWPSKSFVDFLLSPASNFAAGQGQRASGAVLTWRILSGEGSVLLPCALILAAIWAAYRRREEGKLLLVFLVPYYAALCLSKTVYGRHVGPILPLTFVYLVGQVKDVLSERPRNLWGTGMVIMASLGLVGMLGLSAGGQFRIHRRYQQNREETALEEALRHLRGGDADLVADRTYVQLSALPKHRVLPHTDREAFVVNAWCQSRLVENAFWSHFYLDAAHRYALGIRNRALNYTVAKQEMSSCLYWIGTRTELAAVLASGDILHETKAKEEGERLLVVKNRRPQPAPCRAVEWRVLDGRRPRGYPAQRTLWRKGQ